MPCGTEIVQVGVTRRNNHTPEVSMRRCLLVQVLAILLVLSWFSGCTGPEEAVPPENEPSVPADDSEQDTSILPTPEVQPGVSPLEPLPSRGDATVPRGAELAVASSRRDLALRLSIGPESIQLVSVETKEWPDASLGCPQPGVFYTQVLSPGFLVVLEADGATYKYHTDLESYVVLCGDDGPITELRFPVEPGEILDGDPWVPVD
jgi:hypothetical protein